MSKTEEKYDIQEVHIDNKTKFLAIINNGALICKNGRILNTPGALIPGDQPVHQDILDIMQLFVPHMVILVQVPCYKLPKPDYLTSKAALTDEKLKGYYVNGFSVTEKGVLTIKGGILADNGKRTPLNAHTFINPDTSSYPYLDPLIAIVEEAKKEATLYFVEGKFGDGAQPEIFGVAAKQGEEEHA